MWYVYTHVYKPRLEENVVHPSGSLLVFIPFRHLSLTLQRGSHTQQDPVILLSLSPTAGYTWLLMWFLRIQTQVPLLAHSAVITFVRFQTKRLLDSCLWLSETGEL